MILLKDEELDQLISPSKMVDVIEHAMISDERKEFYVPPRTHINREKNTYLLMPAYSDAAFGTKIVSVLPSNSFLGLPIINGLYSLNDAQNGTIRALMSAPRITALRTGAIAGVAIRALTDPKIESFGIIGPGVQAIEIARCVASIRPIKKIFVVGRSSDPTRFFMKQMKKHLPDVRINILENAHDLLKNTQTIITATTSENPVLPDHEDLIFGKTFIAMGSYKKNMRELPDSVFRLGKKIITDAPGTRFEVGDVLYPLEQRLVDEEDILTLGKVLTKKYSVPSETKVFKSAGYALFDLFAAQELYEQALRTGKGISFNF